MTSSTVDIQHVRVTTLVVSDDDMQRSGRIGRLRGGASLAPAR
ncbi:MAG TPA: hypothetical protein VMM76_24625 [Pirellulaceae bacterium]|nr:hypothetical protein [Pirellulaceae bacterium]